MGGNWSCNLCSEEIKMDTKHPKSKNIDAKGKGAVDDNIINFTETESNTEDEVTPLHK